METVEDAREACLAIPPSCCDRWAKSSVMEGTDQPGVSVWGSRTMEGSSDPTDASDGDHEERTVSSPI